MTKNFVMCKKYLHLYIDFHKVDSWIKTFFLSILVLDQEYGIAHLWNHTFKSSCPFSYPRTTKALWCICSFLYFRKCDSVTWSNIRAVWRAMKQFSVEMFQQFSSVNFYMQSNVVMQENHAGSQHTLHLFYSVLQL